jgi:prepilin-type N-terminal cleavage/methylation domain-containing protein
MVHGTPSNTVLTDDRQGAESGFTMMEIVVALTIMAIMVAVIVPSLKARIDQAGIATLQTTLDNVLEGIRNYKTNVTRYPQRLQQLSIAPNSLVPSDLCGTSIISGTPALSTNWRGPYISMQIDTTTSGSSTPRGLSIGDYVANDLLVRSPTTSTTPGRVDVLVPSVIQADWLSLNDAVDGTSVPPLAANGDDTSGTVHWSSTSHNLYYGMVIAGC